MRPQTQSDVGYWRRYPVTAAKCPRDQPTMKLDPFPLAYAELSERKS